MYKRQDLERGQTADVIDLTSEDESISTLSAVIDLTIPDTKERKVPSKPRINSPFKMLRSVLYDDETPLSQNLITLKDILGDETLRESILFSFQFDLNFVMDCFHENIKSITIVAQLNTIVPFEPSQGPKARRIFSRLNTIAFPMPPFSCHHSKMIFNYYADNSCKIFLPSSNLSYYEVNLPQQVCWCSPTLPYDPDRKSRQDVPFKVSLLEYLNSYNKREVNQLIKRLKDIDFTPLEDVEFIFSTPNKKVNSGMKMLASFINEGKIVVPPDDGSSTSHFLCQTSSIGASLNRAVPVNMFTHTIIPLCTGILSYNQESNGKKAMIYVPSETVKTEFKSRRIIPYIIFPTKYESLNGPTGSAASGWFHFDYSKDKIGYYKMLAEEFKVFYKQDSKKSADKRNKRPFVPSHSKFYLSSTTTENDTSPNQFKNLNWCIFTSANLSVSAWGKLLSLIHI